MKKLFMFVVAVSLALPVVASAATFVVAPSSGTYKTGDLVTLNISVNPTGSTIYTAMLDARFSPDTFEVVSFTLNDSLLALKQSGYDALNNGGGVLTKTGGYTGGATAVSSFGTLVLRAKAAGTATFTVADSSKLYDGNNADQQSGAQTNSYVVTAAAPVQQASVPVQQESSATVRQETRPTGAQAQTATDTVEAESTVTEAATSSQLAAAGSSAARSMWLWVSIVLGLLAAFAIGYFTGTRRLWR